MFDEATNVNGHKTLIVYTRYFYNCNVHVRYLALLPLTKCKAPDIFNIIFRMIDKFSLQGIQIIHENNPTLQIRRNIRIIATNVIESFSRIENQKDIIKALSYFTIENIRTQKEREIQSQEFTYLEAISTFYSKVPAKAMPYAELVTEYRNLKTTVLDKGNNISDNAILSEIIDEKVYSLFEKLFSITISLSPSTCQCERGFGLPSFLQNKWRNRLKIGGLNALMQIKLNSENFKEINTDLLYKTWMNKDFEGYSKLLEGKINEEIFKGDLDFEDEMEEYNDEEEE